MKRAARLPALYLFVPFAAGSAGMAGALGSYIYVPKAARTAWDILDPVQQTRIHITSPLDP